MGRVFQVFLGVGDLLSGQGGPTLRVLCATERTLSATERVLFATERAADNVLALIRPRAAARRHRPVLSRVPSSFSLRFGWVEIGLYRRIRAAFGARIVGPALAPVSARICRSRLWREIA